MSISFQKNNVLLLQKRSCPRSHLPLNSNRFFPAACGGSHITIHVCVFLFCIFRFYILLGKELCQMYSHVVKHLFQLILKIWRVDFNISPALFTFKIKEGIIKYIFRFEYIISATFAGNRDFRVIPAKRFGCLLYTSGQRRCEERNTHYCC